MKLHLTLPLLALCALPAFGQARDTAKRPLFGSEHEQDPSEGDQTYAKALGAELGLEVAEVRALRRAAWSNPNRPEVRFGPFKGVSFRLRGPKVDVVVRRLRFKDISGALNLLEGGVQPGTRMRIVLDQRGKDLIVLSGASLDDPKRAGWILGAAWEVGRFSGQRGSIAVLPPSKDGKGEEFAAQTHTSGELYQSIAKMFRVARQGEDEGKSRNGPVNWTFADAVRNEVRVDVSGQIDVHALVSPKAVMTVVLTSKRARTDAEWRYLLALLEAQKRSPERAKGMVELLPLPR